MRGQIIGHVESLHYFLSYCSTSQIVHLNEYFLLIFFSCTYFFFKHYFVRFFFLLKEVNKLVEETGYKIVSIFFFSISSIATASFFK